MSQTAEWLDAKGFVAWLESRGVGLAPREAHGGIGRALKGTGNYDRLMDRWDRAFRRWKVENEVVSVYSADEFLIAHGLHLSEVPEGLYRERKWGQG